MILFYFDNAMIFYRRDAIFHSKCCKGIIGFWCGIGIFFETAFTHINVDNLPINLVYGISLRSPT